LTTKALGYLRTNFLHELGEGPHTILITSALSGEGKSTVTRGLAESLAQYGKQTLMVDADLRRPKLAGAYKLAHSIEDEHLELKSQLQGHSHKVMRLNFAAATLDFIPSLKALGEESISLLNQGMQRCIEQWQQNYELTLIDSAPILPVADTLIIAPHCSATVLVVNLQKTHKKQLQATMDILQRLGVNILGVVVTHVAKAR
jgi:capsular exopolysaccharide synthesis family protein